MNTIEDTMKKDPHSPFNLDERKLDDLLRKLHEQNKDRKPEKVRTRTLPTRNRS
jgi:hypothetical protein